MKKLMIVVLAMIMSLSAFAVKIGYVNSQEVMAKYSETKNINEKIMEIQNFTKAVEAKGKKPTVVEETKYKSMAIEIQSAQKDRYNLFNASINSVAKKEKYEYIFEQGAVMFGGQNVTQKVLKQMEASKKIKLN